MLHVAGVTALSMQQHTHTETPGVTEEMTALIKSAHVFIVTLYNVIILVVSLSWVEYFTLYI